MEEHTTNEMQKIHYRKLLWMVIFSFIAMYLLMYSMVDRFANVIPNYNQLYMTGLMTGAMIIIEMVLMGSMYLNKKLNAFIIAISAVVSVACFLFITNRTNRFYESQIERDGQ